jgi:hypothetical protein
MLGLYENCPSDFSFLRMQDTPPSGGDTLWCSGYELYVAFLPDETPSPLAPDSLCTYYRTN